MDRRRRIDRLRPRCRRTWRASAGRGQSCRCPHAAAVLRFLAVIELARRPFEASLGSRTNHINQWVKFELSRRHTKNHTNQPAPTSKPLSAVPVQPIAIRIVRDQINRPAQALHVLAFGPGAANPERLHQVCRSSGGSDVVAYLDAIDTVNVKLARRVRRSCPGHPHILRATIWRIRNRGAELLGLHCALASLGNVICQAAGHVEVDLATERVNVDVFAQQRQVLHLVRPLELFQEADEFTLLAYTVEQLRHIEAGQVLTPNLGPFVEGLDRHVVSEDVSNIHLVNLNQPAKHVISIDLRALVARFHRRLDGLGYLRFFQVLVADLSGCPFAVPGSDSGLRCVEVNQVLINEQALLLCQCHGVSLLFRRFFSAFTRSEERRVGKECSCRWSPDH